MALSESSRKALAGVHPDLIKVAELGHDHAIHNGLDFIITEGCRSIARQRLLIASGASSLKDPFRSRHVPSPESGLGHAFDFAPLVGIGGEPTFKWPAFYPIAECIKTAAKTLNIPIEWGGDWRTFKDGPHVQLPWKQYP